MREEVQVALNSSDVLRSPYRPFESFPKRIKVHGWHHLP